MTACQVDRDLRRGLVGAFAWLVTVLAPMNAIVAQEASQGASPGANQGDAGSKSKRDTIDYRNPQFGFSLRVPADVFESAETRNTRAGSLWNSRDGQARLVAAAQANETSESLQSYRRFLMEQIYEQAKFDYAPVRDTWFVLSGTFQDGRLFYERVTFACSGRYIYGWQLIYPPADKRLYDRIVEAIHRSYRAGQGPNGNCE